MRKIQLKLLCLFCVFLADATTAADSGKDSPNVILITFDGVRWSEFFGRTDFWLRHGDRAPILSHFWNSGLGSRGVAFGNRSLGSTVRVSNRPRLSLPGYQSILAGYEQPCKNNGCGRIQVETLQERLVREAGISANQVVTIASWDQIANASEHIVGSTFVNAGQMPLEDGTDDPELKELNQNQATDIPPWGNRWDKYTFKQGLRYLKVHQPRFLFLSLLDTDEWAHEHNYKNYVEALRQYDKWLDELDHTLQSMGEYGRNTIIIMTTDHGRGHGPFWHNHGYMNFGSGLVYLVGIGPNIKARGMVEDSPNYQHRDIRPTIETLFGLKPIQCRKCGKPIPEFLGIEEQDI